MIFSVFQPFGLGVFFFFNYLFVYFTLCWAFIAVCGLSRAVASRGCSLAVEDELLTAMASLVAEHRL